MSQSGRLNAPSSVQARRMATISAWAVGSLLDVTSFQPSAMIVSLRTMTAPNGPPLLARIFSSASATARCINACSLISQSPRQLGAWCLHRLTGDARHIIGDFHPAEVSPAGVPSELTGQPWRPRGCQRSSASGRAGPACFPAHGRLAMHALSLANHLDVEHSVLRQQLCEY